MSNEYEVKARNSGKPAEEVEKAYEFVKNTYGKILKDDERLIWWQTCNRLGVKVDSPEEDSRSKSGGSRGRNLRLKDFDTIEHKDNVNLEGMVYLTRHDPGDGTEERPERFSMWIADKTGKGKVSTKNPEIIPLLEQQKLSPGDFVRIQGGFGWVMDVDDRKEPLRGVALTKYSQVQINKKFDPTTYFTGAGEDALEDRQPCIVQGIVLQSKNVNFDACPHRNENGRICGAGHRRDDPECFRGHTNYGEWDPSPQTFLTVHDENGAYEVAMDDHHNFDGHEITVIGLWVTRNDGSGQIRAMHWKTKDVMAVGSDVLKKDTAKASVLKTIKSFNPCPKHVVVSRIKEELGTKTTDSEAEALIVELIDDGKVNWDEKMPDRLRAIEA